MGKAFFWMAGSDGSSWYRQTLPALGLQWRGWRVGASVQMSLPAVADADAVIGARVASPEGVRAWDALGRAGVPRILDLDDDYFSIDPTNARAAEFWAKDGMLGRLAAAMESSDLVTVVSEGLAEAMRQRTSTPVMVVGNHLPAQYLDAPREYTVDRPVVVGWAGSTSTSHELPIIARALMRLPSLQRGVQVKLVGVTAEEAVRFGIGGPHVTATGWVPEPAAYLRQVMAFDVWLAPYRPTPFNLAKYPTKALEASVLGIPLVASSTRPYQDWVAEHGPECGVTLVKHEHEWTRNLKALTDPHVGDFMRQGLGHGASSAAARHTLQSGVADWMTAINVAKEAKRRGAGR